MMVVGTSCTEIRFPKTLGSLWNLLIHCDQLTTATAPSDPAGIILRGPISRSIRLQALSSAK